MVVALETIIDVMIDISICLTLTNHMCTLHIQLNEHLFYHDYSCIHVKLQIILFVNLYDHASHFYYMLFSFCLITLIYYICKCIQSCTPCMLSHVLFFVLFDNAIIFVDLYDHTAPVCHHMY